MKNKMNKKFLTFLSIFTFIFNINVTKVFSATPPTGYILSSDYQRDFDYSSSWSSTNSYIHYTEDVVTSGTPPFTNMVSTLNVSDISRVNTILASKGGTLAQNSQIASNVFDLLFAFSEPYFGAYPAHSLDIGSYDGIIGGDHQWRLNDGSIGVNEKSNHFFRLKVKNNIPDGVRGVFSSHFHSEDGALQADTYNVFDKIIHSPVLSINKTVTSNTSENCSNVSTDSITVAPNSQVKFCVTIRNSGSGKGYDLHYEDVLPSGFTLVSGTLSEGGAGTRFAPDPAKVSLYPGYTPTSSEWSNNVRTYEIVATAPSVAGNYVNTAKLSSANITNAKASNFSVANGNFFEGDPANVSDGYISDSATVIVSAPTNLSITKSVNFPSPQIINSSNGELSGTISRTGTPAYTIVVSNSGSTPSGNVTITDTISSATNGGTLTRDLQTALVSSSSGATNCKVSATTNTITILASCLDQNENVTITYSGNANSDGITRVPSGQTRQVSDITNTAQVTTPANGPSSSATIRIAGAMNPSVEIIKNANPSNVEWESWNNKNITYTINYRVNKTDSWVNAENVVVYDILPQNTSYVSSNPTISGTCTNPSGCNISGTSVPFEAVYWNIGTASNQEYAQLILNLSVQDLAAPNPGETNTLENRVAISSTNAGSDQSSAETVITRDFVAPTLNISKSVSPVSNSGNPINYDSTASWTEGDHRLKYTINWSVSGGNSSATNLILTDLLPNSNGHQLTYVENSLTNSFGSNSCSFSGNNLNCNFGTVSNSGTNYEISFLVDVLAPNYGSTDTYTNFASIDADNTANKNSNEVTSYVYRGTAPSLIITKQVSKDEINWAESVNAEDSEEEVFYRINITNSGQTTANNVSVTDTIGENSGRVNGASGGYVSFSGDEVIINPNGIACTTCGTINSVSGVNFSSIGGGQTATITYRGVVENSGISPVEFGQPRNQSSAQNTATVNSTETTPISDTAEVIIFGEENTAPVINVTKQVSTSQNGVYYDSIGPSGLTNPQDVWYKIVLENVGGSTGTASISDAVLDGSETSGNLSVTMRDIDSSGSYIFGAGDVLVNNSSTTPTFSGTTISNLSILSGQSVTIYYSASIQNSGTTEQSFINTVIPTGDATSCSDTDPNCNAIVSLEGNEPQIITKEVSLDGTNWSSQVTAENNNTEIYYKITYKNNESFPLRNLQIIDTMGLPQSGIVEGDNQGEIQFISGSESINLPSGVNYSGSINSEDGIFIEEFPAGALIEIFYRGTTANSNIPSNGNLRGTSNVINNVIITSIDATASQESALVILVGPNPNPNISVLKEVSLLNNSNWEERVSANNGDAVYYRLTISNNSPFEAGVTIEDDLWNDINYPSTQNWVNFDGPFNSQSVTTSQNIVNPIYNSSDKNLSVLIPANSTGYIYYSGVATKSSDITDVESFENVAFFTPTGGEPISDSAFVDFPSPANINFVKHVALPDSQNPSVPSDYAPAVTLTNSSGKVFYRLTISNTGGTATNVTVSDNIFDGTITGTNGITSSLEEVFENHSQFQFSPSGTTHSFNDSENSISLYVPANSQITITYKADVVNPSINSGSVQNVATITTTENQNSTSSSIVNVPPASILTQKSVENLTRPGATTETNPAGAGDILRYSLITQNLSSNQITLDIVDNISDILQYANVQDLNGGVLDSQTSDVRWSSVSIPANQSVVKTITFVVKPADEWPTYNPQNDLTDMVLENVYGNNVEVPLFDPSVNVDKFVEILGDPSTRVGENVRNSGVLQVQGEEDIKYTIRVENTSQTTLYNVKISDEFRSITGGDNLENIRNIQFSPPSSGSTFSTIESDNFYVNIGSIPSNSSVYVSFEATVPQSSSNTIRNVATAISSNDLPIPKTTLTDDYVDVQSEVGSVSIQKVLENLTRDYSDDTSTNISALPGDEVKYKLIVTNDSTVNLQNITVTDEIQDGTTYVEESASDGGEYENKVLNWRISLDSGESKELTFMVRVDQNVSYGDIIENVAIADIPNSSTKEDSNTTEIRIVQPRIEVIKTADRKVVNPGEFVDYTIEVKNLDNVVAKNLEITDTLPNELIFVSSNPETTPVERVLKWTLSELAGNQSFVISVRVQVSENAVNTQIENIATVTYTDENNTTYPPVKDRELVSTGTAILLIILISILVAFGLYLFSKKRKNRLTIK